MKITFGFFVILFFSFRVGATSLALIPVEELFKEADTVVIVEVVSGQMLENFCGAKYKARIVHNFKGIDSEFLHFGHYPGYEIEGRYLLFLTNPDRWYTQLSTTNSTAEAAVEEFHKKCDEVLDINRVMHTGAGALEITKSPNEVVVHTEYIVFPESVPSRSAEFDKCGAVSKYVWIREKLAIEYLESIANGRN
jgi:hypothetical protein